MNFSKAFSPVAITVVIALIAIVISLGVTDRAIKESNHILSYHSMGQHLKNIQDFQETMVLDYTEWSATFDNLTIKNDMEWFKYSIGGANLLQRKIHGLAFIKNNSTLVDQHTRKNNKQFFITQETINQDFPQVKQNLLSDNTQTARTFSYFKNINGLPALLSFSPITHPNPDAYPDFPQNRRDFLLFWTILTPELLAQTSDALKLRGLTVTSEQSSKNFALKDSMGQVTSLLKWTLKKEKASPLTLSFYTSLTMFSLLLLGGYFSYKRIFDLIRQLDLARKHAETDHRIKSEFLATMSHELRTPLNSIIGFTDILELNAGNPLNDKQREYIDHIKSSSRHLLTIINEILDMSKIEAGKYDLVEHEIDLKRILNQSIIFLEKDAKDKNIRLIKNIPQVMNEFMGDEKVIRQLMLNLINNAIKFTPEGGQVNITCLITQEGCLQITVEDNGIGISSEKLDTITEPYQQDQDHKTRSHQGTGLGLTISKAFVEMHQGTLDIKSERGVGTCITITFPSKRVLPEIV